MNGHLLLVDDDRALIDVLTDALRQYTIVNASDGVAAMHQLMAEQPDLVLVDLRLPGMDGAVLLSRIRAVSRVPIIVLSARHEQADIVGALKYADDFVAKPFDLYDLEARIEAVLRRSPQVVRKNPAYTVGGLVISAGGLSTMDGDQFFLTLTEHKVLLVLARRAGALVTSDQLYSEVWNSTSNGWSRNNLSVHVQRIRKRLARHPGAPSIVTARGRGFILQAPR